MSYYSFLNHSYFSFLQGSSSPKHLISATYDSGYRGIGMCDFDGFYGSVDFWRNLKPYNHISHQSSTDVFENFQAKKETLFEGFYGAEVLYKPRSLFKGIYPDKSSYKGDNQDPIFLQNRIALFATDTTSYAQICQTVSYSKGLRNVMRKTPELPSELPSELASQKISQDTPSQFSTNLSADHEIDENEEIKEKNENDTWSKIAIPLDLNDTHLWPNQAKCIVPCRGQSQLFSHRNSHCFSSFIDDLSVLKHIFGNNLYLALTIPTTPLEWNAFQNHIRASKELNIPCLATPDVFFDKPESKEILDVLLAIKHNRKLKFNHWSCFSNTHRHVTSLVTFVEFFSKTKFLQKALQNNLQLSQSLHFSLDQIVYQYPKEFLPKNLTAIEYLKILVEKGSKERYKNCIPNRVEELLVKELNLIEELHFADYFLTVFDIVSYAEKQKILFQGRGSAANSCVCFVLGITAVDPMSSEVLFERFISRERGEPPDIDVDFEHEKREEVIQYIYSRYGRNKAAMVANIISFRTKGALRFVGKALGIEDALISRVMSHSKTKTQKRHNINEILSLVDNHVGIDSETLDLWSRLSQAIKGFPRHLGIHSGGFIINQNPVCHIVPVEPATMSGRTVIQWNKDDLESLGLFKIDVLALGMLTALRKTLHALEDHGKLIPGTKVPINMNSIPPDCPKTYDMIRLAKTVGVFQIESRAQMSMLPRVLPCCFYDLVVEVGLVRPGPIVSGIVSTYVRRRQGQETVSYPDPRLKPILERTLGVPVFQEQVMRIAIEAGDFTPGEADELRRAMGQWKISGRINQFREKLFTGMRKRNISETFANEICAQIEGFSEYGFPESHATSFAILSYISSYLKAHYPVYFLMGLLNSQPLGFYSPHMLIQEFKREGVDILSPCFFDSEWDSYVNTDQTLQLGLRLIPGLHKDRVIKFLEKRKIILKKQDISLCTGATPEIFQDSLLHQSFDLLDCFMADEKINIIMAGTLRKLNSDRRSLLWRLLAKPSHLFDDVETRLFSVASELQGTWEDVCDDFKFGQTSLTEHPVYLIKKLFWPFIKPVEKVTKNGELSSHKSGDFVFVCGLLIVRQFPPTAKGMCFITLEDESGTVQIAINPILVKTELAKIMGYSFFCIGGKCQKQGPKNVSLMATSILEIKNVETFLSTPKSISESAKSFVY